MKCEQCGNEHDGSYGTGRFCSESCKQTFVANKVINRKSGFTINQPQPRAMYGTWTCRICGVIFNTRAELRRHMNSAHPYDKSHAWNYRKTKETDKRIKDLSEKVSKSLKEGFNSGRIKPAKWSEENRLKQSKRAKERKLGGYHKHGGRGIRGWYRGYWCDSSWELAYVIYNLEHGIHFVRNKVGFDYFYDGMTRKYYPDYILDDGTYVEVKGYADEKVKVKHETFISSGHTLQVIGKTEIQPYLDYVIEKYGKNFTSLYE